MPNTKKINRRKFLQYTGALTGAAATAGLASAANAATSAPAPSAHDHAKPVSQAEAVKPLHRGRMFFTNDAEFSAVSALAERIFPKDELGPGAIELAVPYFIDNQLAGAWGYNAREYTQGPHFIGAPTQGYQTPLLRRDIFKQGIYTLNATAQERFKKDFARLSAEQQEQIMTDCASNKLTVPGVTSGYFFSLFKSAVLAGAYSDPMYNGNNNMDGWRMKQYPGAQMAYSWLMTSEEFQVIDPVSLSSMQ